MCDKHLEVEPDALVGGEGVDIPANGIHLAGNFFRGAMFGPLEDHVLDEMRNPIPLLVFIARTGLDPDPDTNGANVFHFLGDDGQPIVQRSAADIAICVLMHCPYSHTPARPAWPGGYVSE